MAEFTRYRIEFHSRTRYNFILVQYPVSVFVYLMPTKISFQDDSAFQNGVIPVVAPHRKFCSRTRSGSTFHRYHLKEVRGHSGAELDTWIGWADQLSHSRTFHRYHVKQVRAHSGAESGTWIGWAQLTPSRTFHRYHIKEVRAHSRAELDTCIGWADQKIFVFDPPMILQHFYFRVRTSM